MPTEQEINKQQALSILALVADVLERPLDELVQEIDFPVQDEPGDYCVEIDAKKTYIKYILAPASYKRNDEVLTNKDAIIGYNALIMRKIFAEYANIINLRPTIVDGWNESAKKLYPEHDISFYTLEFNSETNTYYFHPDRLHWGPKFIIP